MKQFKTFTFVAKANITRKLFVLLLAFFTASSVSAQEIVGSWQKAIKYGNKGDRTITYSFNSDGNMTVTIDDKLDYAWDMYFIKYNPAISIPGKYSIDGSTIALELDFSQFVFYENEKLSVTGNPDKVNPKLLTKAMTANTEFRIFKECREMLLSDAIYFSNNPIGKFKISGDELTMMSVTYTNTSHEDKQAVHKTAVQRYGAVNGKNVTDCMVKVGMTLDMVKAMFGYIENRGGSNDKVYLWTISPIRTIKSLPKRKFNFEVDINRTTNKVTKVKNVPVVMM